MCFFNAMSGVQGNFQKKAYRILASFISKGSSDVIIDQLS